MYRFSVRESCVFLISRSCVLCRIIGYRRVSATVNGQSSAIDLLKSGKRISMFGLVLTKFSYSSSHKHTKLDDKTCLGYGYESSANVRSLSNFAGND
jgi:hypothetical protein